MLRILHLSDLHYGLLLPVQRKPNNSASAHRYCKPGVDEPDPTALAEVLRRDPELLSAPDVVIVSGDVGWSGAATDYEYAEEFLNHLRSMWPKSSFVIAPGNHDVDWSRGLPKGSPAVPPASSASIAPAPSSSAVIPSTSAPSAGSPPLAAASPTSSARAATSPTVDAAQDAYFQFLQRFHGSSLRDQYKILNIGPPLNRESLVAIHASEVNGDPFLIVAVNTAAYMHNDELPVYVTPRILTAIEDQLRGASEEALRIFVLHHHLLPFAESKLGTTYVSGTVPDKPDDTILANSAKLQVWLSKNGFHVVLHGHKHNAHGREDVLWRKQDPRSGRRVLVVGAGSAGVEATQRGKEPLSYNVLLAHRLSRKRWRVDAHVRQISEDDATDSAEVWYDYGTDVGPQVDEARHYFHAERMDDCHAAIRKATEGKGLLKNFISVIDRPDYLHPLTAMLARQPATEADVRKCFRALHPEHKLTEGWKVTEKLPDALREINPRFQFQHGPRLFGVPGGEFNGRGEKELHKIRPIMTALHRIGSESESNAYVSLYSPEIDVLATRNEPLPALMSLQFVKSDRRHLDLVATFRKIDLSFWWVVNMYEIIALLKWAADMKELEARRITFFAALAEWKTDPEPAFITQLDDYPLSNLVSLSTRVWSGDTAAVDELIGLLEEKKQHTNDKNLDASGLERLSSVLSGIQIGGSQQKDIETFADHVSLAAEHVRVAMAPQRQDHTARTKACDALTRAISSLGEYRASIRA